MPPFSASIQTTMNIYADVTRELKKSEFDGLDGFFRKNREAHQTEAQSTENAAGEADTD